MKARVLSRLLQGALLSVALGSVAGGCNRTPPAPPPPAPAPAPPPAPAPAPPPAADVQAAPEPLVAGPAHPSDEQLSAYVREVSAAIVHAARGEAVDRRFVSAHPVHTVAALSAQDRERLAVFGPTLTVVGTEVELDAVARPGPGEHYQVMVHALVLPDGRVHWGPASGRRDADESVHPTPGVDRDAPALNASVNRVTEALRTSCSLPWVTEADLTVLPAVLRRELLPEVGTTRAACRLVAGVRGEWRTHFDDLRVFVQGNGHVGILRGTFNVENADTDGGGHLVLAPVHIEVVSGEGDGGAPSAPAAPAAPH